MSRIAKKPVKIPAGVEVRLNGQTVSVKGPKGSAEYTVHKSVGVSQGEEGVLFAPTAGNDAGVAMVGTMRSLVANMVSGVSQGFEKRLTLVGVGYRAQAKGQVLTLTLGYSHPIDFPVPEGIAIETPSATEIVVRGADMQKVGQVAAEVRSLRPPEPYKGKGVKYAEEQIVRKEAKKK
jgi:large subunit ribosomal protein L6